MRNLFLGLALLACWTSSGGDLSRTADHDYDVPPPGSYTLPIVRPGADGAIIDAEAGPMRLHRLTKGRITVLSFIYTRCASAKACPYATGVLLRLHQLSAQDPSLAKLLRLISMSFDPANDTPERMAAYAKIGSTRPSAAEWRFVTTESENTLRPILEAYGQAVDRKSNPNDPAGPLNHTLRVLLLDPEGNIRNIYSSGTLDVRLVLADIQTLRLENERLAAAR
jgi:cytochrome oxidase Cu insertion factor (SCO1/SenC/PrrC family)